MASTVKSIAESLVVCMRGRPTTFLLFSFVFLGLSAATVWGQGSQVAQIVGTVNDSAGAAIAGAQVKATQTSTGLARTATSASDGGFTITNLPVGPYVLEVSKEGFSTLVQEGIVLEMNASPTVNSTLKPGSPSERVVVQVTGAMVNARGTGQGQTVDQERVREMPLQGRQVTSLVTTSSSAVESQDTTLVSNKNYPGSTSFSVAGAQGGQTLYLMDGVINMDAVSNVSMPWPFPDALQEFKVESSSLPANYGMAPGGVVNVITKSGGNQFPRRSVRIQPRLPLQRAQLLRAGTGRAQAQPVWGTAGRPDRQEQDLLLRRISGHARKRCPCSLHRIRADTGHVEWGLHGNHVPRMQCRTGDYAESAVHEQQDRPCPVRSGRSKPDEISARF